MLVIWELYSWIVLGSLVGIAIALWVIGALHGVDYYYPYEPNPWIKGAECAMGIHALIFAAWRGYHILRTVVG